MRGPFPTTLAFRKQLLTLPTGSFRLALREAPVVLAHSVGQPPRGYTVLPLRVPDPSRWTFVSAVVDEYVLSTVDSQ